MSSSPAVPKKLLASIARAAGASSVQVGDTIQTLWSGYGGIIQLALSGIDHETAVLKLISPPETIAHPRGWNTNASHARKLQSYQVETHWYEHFSNLCNNQCRVPKVLATGSFESSRWILLEDLDEDYSARATGLTPSDAKVCLDWLAAFHARFLGTEPDGLWSTGTYWHLATRADELDAMPEDTLKAMAWKLNSALNDCPHQTLVHGDAKVANFCFSENFDSVAAVDFQYVGGGVGVKDVAYFLGSCIDEATLETQDTELLEYYFDALSSAISQHHNSELANTVVEAWSDLYAVAWTDFYRFLAGWSPTHHKINGYTRMLADKALCQLD